jgi:soluble lytic murein transglycosylase-like protein
MRQISRNAAVKAGLVLGLVAGLSACSSTDLTTSSVTGNKQVFALATSTPRVAATSFSEAHKQREATRKQNLAADARKRKAEIAKRQQAAAKQKLDREAKRLAAFDRMTKSLTEQQKQLLKPQRDQILKSKGDAQNELAKLTPKPRYTGGGKGSGYHALIAKYARANGIPLKLAHAVVRVESSYRANARGAAGEVGLMQLRPATARLMGYRGSTKGLYNPETNIKYGMKYLGKAHKLAKGSTCGTILKYNAGHGAKRMNPISARYCKRVRRYI